MLYILKVAAVASVVTYIVSAAGLYVFQRQLLYRPDTLRTPPNTIGLTGVSEIMIEAQDGAKLVAWHAPARSGAPTILYFHGNGGSLAMRRERLVRFQAAGFGVFMVAYRGYSGSAGVPSEAAIITDALHVYDTLVAREIPAERIVLYGESLGSGVAVQVAAQRKAGAVILDAPFTSVTDVAKYHYALFPVGLLLRDRYDSAAHIRRVNAPLLILHGELDAVVPFMFGKKLYEIAPEPKQFAVFPRGNHSDLYLHGAMPIVEGFIARHVASTGAPRSADENQTRRF